MPPLELAIVGGGPAGYVAAVRGAQLGAHVTLIERERLGGACINRACIPTKYLLHAVETLHTIKNAGQFGISVPDPAVDIARVQLGKTAVIARLVDSLQGLMEANGVNIIKGNARLEPGKRVVIDRGNGTAEIMPADRVILATGSTPSSIPIPGADAPDILRSETILNLDHVPKSLLMIGGGVVGVEMASILGGLGCKVTIVEILPHILPAEDAETAGILEKALRRLGVTSFAGTGVITIESVPGGKRVTLAAPAGEKRLEVEAVALAVGQRAFTGGLGLAEAEVKLEKGRIITDGRLETSVPGVFAAGDVTSRLMLAYVAMHEGKTAAENALGASNHVNYDVVPRCIFSLPEMASVGLSEEEARMRGLSVKCGRFPFAASSMAAILGERRGQVKVIAEAGSSKVVGVHIIGPKAVDLIAEATVAMKMGATTSDIADTIHAHPTLSEAFWNAALDVDGLAIDFKA